MDLGQLEGWKTIVRPAHILKGATQINNSGSAIFIETVNNEGVSRRRLIGLMEADGSNGESAFQAIDWVLPGLNGELGGYRAVKLVDYAFGGA